MSKLPCVDCICMPICRKKNYLSLMMNCRPVADYTYFLDSDQSKHKLGVQRLAEVQAYLGSTGFKSIPEINLGIREPE